jgi:hypothetical protein
MAQADIKISRQEARCLCRLLKTIGELPNVAIVSILRNLAPADIATLTVFAEMAREKSKVNAHTF